MVLDESVGEALVKEILLLPAHALNQHLEEDHKCKVHERLHRGRLDQLIYPEGCPHCEGFGWRRLWRLWWWGRVKIHLQLGEGNVAGA